MKPTVSNHRGVGGEIRARRQAIGLSQLNLAALAGCCLNSVVNLEGGVVPRRSALLAALERAERDFTVGVPPDAH